jgi:peptidoglycan/LPS O-acetylase OafA/YrhL
LLAVWPANLDNLRIVMKFWKLRFYDAESATHIKSATVSIDRLLPGIHGLRGIAALAVVLFHLVHLAKIDAPEFFKFISSDFGKGVHLFFVLSAFSLLYSTEHSLHRQTWAIEYYVKRLFRIAPLYYVILAGMVLWPLVKSHTLSFSPQALFLNLTFTFGFAPWSGIVWAGWTVGVEMIFYAVLPVLLLTVRSTSATFILVIISVLVTYTARSILYEHYEFSISRYGYNWAYFSFASNVCFFAMGMYAFRLARQADKASLMMRWFLPGFTVVLLGSLMCAETEGPLRLLKNESILWGVGFTALCVWQSTRPSRWSANRFFEYLGERSYSIYLLHPVVLIFLKSPIQAVNSTLATQLGAYAYFICAALILIPLIALAEVTYRLIEVPGIEYGKKINRRIRERARILERTIPDGSCAARKYSE